MANYYYAKDDKTQGPFSLPDMEVLCRTQLKPDTMVIRDGEQEWSKCSEHPEISGLMPKLEIPLLNLYPESDASPCCPECKKKVAPDALRCPSCGKQLAEEQTVVGIVAAIVLALIICAVAWSLIPH